jgi:sugar phosphate isomerase/epimerase
MPASSLAVQMYTLREVTKTPADTFAALRRVKKMGYDAVQMGTGGLDAKELAKVLRDEGLVCCSTGYDVARLRDHREQVIEEHRLLDCKYTMIGGHFPKTATADDWAQYARDLNTIAKPYEGTPVRIGYHNHSHELIRYGKTTALDILVKTLIPSVWIEIDTYWIQHGGGDPVDWINRVAGRIPCVHLKDMSITLERKQLFAEVGEGNLNWPNILRACKAAGVQWYIVEQDVCQRDPFESLEISLKNLREMGMT